MPRAFNFKLKDYLFQLLLNRGVCSMESIQGLNEEDLLSKRLKTRTEAWDCSIRRTAEIVLFLSGMAQMRGGRVPSIIERGLMEEARQRLGHMVGLLTPSDLVSEDFVSDMVEDLGFSRKEVTGNSAATLGEKFAERKAEFATRIDKLHHLAATRATTTSSHTILEQPTALALSGVAQSVSVAQGAPVAHPGHLFAQTMRTVQPYQMKTPFPTVTSSPIGYPLATIDQRTKSGKPNEASSSIPDALLPPATSQATLKAQRPVVEQLDQVSPMVPRVPTAHPMALFPQKTRLTYSGGLTLPVSAAPVAPTATSVSSQAQTIQPDRVSLSVPVPKKSLSPPATVRAQTTTVGDPDQMTPSISMELAGPGDPPVVLHEYETRMVQSDGMTSPLPTKSAASILHQVTTTAQGTIGAWFGQTTLTVPAHLPGNMSEQKSVPLSLEFFGRDESLVSMLAPANISFPHQTSLTSSVMFDNSHGIFGSSIASVPGGLVNSVTEQSQAPSKIELSGSMNDHNAIAGAVKQLLQALSSGKREIQPPSRSYMNAQLPCQTCEVIVNDVSSVLICDWCEKAFHISCHQPYPVKDFPKSEWYCSKCFAARDGKPYPTKYGRVAKHTAFQNSSVD